MKKALVSLALTVLLVLSLFSVVKADSTMINLNVSDRGVGFSLMQQTSSSFFAIGVSDFECYQPEDDPAQVFVVMYLAGESRCPPGTVWQKRKGHGWGRTAKEMGLPPNYHGRYMPAKHRHKYTEVIMVDDYDFEEMMVIRFLTEYYGSDPEFLFYWHSCGLGYHDMFIAVNLGARLHRSPREFFEMRRSGRDWRYIAARYGVPYASLSKPVTPVRKFGMKVKNDSDFEEYPEKEHKRKWRKKKH